MIEQTENLSSKKSQKIGEEDYRPKLKHWEKWVREVFRLLGIVGFIVALDQMCFQEPFLMKGDSHTCWSYIGFGFALAGLFVLRFFRHKFVSYDGRLADPSEIRAWIVEAESVEMRLSKPEERPENYSKKIENMKCEVTRLNKIGYKQWTEYQVLSLNQMLIDFMKVDDLKTGAQSTLDQVKEYAQDSAYPYDKEYLHTWTKRIGEALEKIDAVKPKGDDAGEEIGNMDNKDLMLDDAARELRAVLRTLYEHVADYEKNWADGSATVRILILLMAVTIPIVLVMGLVPVLHPSGNGLLGILNWGLLGVSGALTSTMLALRNSDLVEVGNTEGKKEVWRTVLGTALGFVAGVLTFGIFSGGLLSGAAIPSVISNNCCNTGLTPSDIGLSVVWGVASGLLFERVFERVRGITEN